MTSNAAWLKPYATFCFLRDLFGSADHRQWGLIHENAQQHTERLTAPDQPFYRDVCYTYWLQWHLHKQLLEAADFARKKRVVLKGDLPIGVAKSSADTWYSPQLFCMDVSVGSPPDAFDTKGQNWGFPGADCDLQEIALISAHVLETVPKHRTDIAYCLLVTDTATIYHGKHRHVFAPGGCACLSQR